MTNKIILILWGIFSIFFLILTTIIGDKIINEFLDNKIHLEYIGYFILLFELSIAGLKAINEGGHFPIRYLIIFLLSALIFYIAVNKSNLEILEFIVYIIGVISMTILYLYISLKNKKNSLKKQNGKI